jgi:hypothetical protein
MCTTRPKTRSYPHALKCGVSSLITELIHQPRVILAK